MPAVTDRLFHVNVNCSDLDASAAFYRDTVGLTPLTRTTPQRPQPGGAFGLDVVQWDAWILTGADGLAGVALDLLEWKVPSPHRAAGDGGFRRVRLAAGASMQPGPTCDPDGTPVDLVAGASPRVAGLVVGCSDLSASTAFYAEVLGLGQVGAATFCDDRGPDVFAVELVPGVSPARPRAANDLGIYRLAFITDDLDRGYRALLAAGVRPYPPPAALEMGPGLPSLRRGVLR